MLPCCNVADWLKYFCTGFWIQPADILNSFLQVTPPHLFSPPPVSRKGFNLIQFGPWVHFIISSSVNSWSLQIRAEMLHNELVNGGVFCLDAASLREITWLRWRESKDSLGQTLWIAAGSFHVFLPPSSCHSPFIFSFSSLLTLCSIIFFAKSSLIHVFLAASCSSPLLLVLPLSVFSSLQTDAHHDSEEPDRRL